MTIQITKSYEWQFIVRNFNEEQSHSFFIVLRSVSVEGFFLLVKKYNSTIADFD